MKVRSVFISDVHLGTKGCKAKKLLKFLDTIEAENLFLNGDIIDGWALRRRHYWTKSQTEVLRKFLKLSEKMNLIYVAGNHDEFIRPFFKFDFQFGNCQIVDGMEYVDLSGKKWYVTHGDHFDLSMKIPRWIINLFAHIGDWIGNDSNSWTDKMYEVLGTERTILKWLKVKNYDGAICGHTHVPGIKEQYMNSGDWVKNCTALVEHLDGRWEIIEYKKQEEETITEL